LLNAGQASEKFVPMMSLTSGSPQPLNASPNKDGGSFDW
jgi:hypothetical protein